MVRKIQIIAFILACAGLFRIQFGNDISQFHRMDPLLADGEKAVAAAFGESGTRFAVVDLRRWQVENAALKAKMGVEIPGEFLEASDLPDAMTLRLPWHDAVILPAAFDRYPIDFRQELTDLFDRYAKRSYRLLAESFAILLVLLVLIFRKRFFSFVAPIAAAVLATAGMLGWIGEPVNFFQLLCFFVLVGLGIDYTIFHKSVRRADTSRVVLFSFLTSLVGFGMLAFTSFQVTRSMGITLGFGLLFAYFFSISPEKQQVDRDPSPKGWAEQKEQSAGKIQIYLLWLIYRYLGKSVAKIVTFFVVLFVYPFAAAGRDALRANLEKLGTGPDKSRGKTSIFRIFLNFAWSLLDKLDACTLKKNLPKMSVSGDSDWMKGGCFLLSTHVGCIEVLPALRLRSPMDPNTQTPNNPNTSPKVHAFQQMGHDALYTELFTRHLDPEQLTLHAVEDIGVETAVEMKEAVERGEIVLMAGDRLSAQTPKADDGLRGMGNRSREFVRPFFGCDCRWPKGVFRFAKLMECPVYAITCVRTGWNAYEARAKLLGGDLLDDYIAFLESEVRHHPEQWYQFYRFFDIL